MDHRDVREQLEVAAAEPGGLDRVMAGDTIDAAALASHLAGCEDCLTELDRLRRSSNLVRETVATQPPPDLRARTLALIAAVGRDRSPATEPVGLAPVGLAPVALPGAAPAAAVGVAGSRPSEEDARRRRRERLGWVAAAAAALLLAVGATWTAATLTQGEQLREQARDISALGQLTAWQLRIEARDDAERVLLASTPAGAQAGDQAAIGSLAFSPGSNEMVVTATGLEPPESGREYRCWVSVDGERERLGRMYFTADIAFWVGTVDALDRVSDGAIFGVSLAEVGAPSGAGDSVLEGTL
jgi:hypothetical protein